MSSEVMKAKQEAKEQLIENFAQHLEVDPASTYEGEGLTRKLIEWHNITANLVQEFKALKITFNNAFYKGTPLIHILLASPYLPLNDKRKTISRLRAFIPGTDTDILDANSNTTLHYFFKKLMSNPTILFLESMTDKGFTDSLFGAGPEMNNKDADGKTALDLLSEIIENGVIHNVQDESLKERLQVKFAEVLPKLQEFKKELIVHGAKRSALL